MSRDPDDEYFSDGLAEELINLLAHVPDLKVTARTSSFAFRGKEQDIRRIAESLGVGTILEGSVRRAGTRIRVTAQLINAEDGYHLWSERYDRELTDVFAIQDDIAQAIAGALQLKLVAKADRHTPDVPAYEALLKARHHWRAYLPEAHARAKEYCEQAIALDPDVCRTARVVRFQLSSCDDAQWQADAGGRAADSPGSSESSGAGPLRNRSRISCSARLQPCTTTIGRKPRAISSWRWPVRPCQPRRTGPMPPCT